MRWIACLAVSFAMLRLAESQHEFPPFLLGIITVCTVCWTILVYDLAYMLFPQFFRVRPIRDVLLGDWRGRVIEANGVAPWMSLEEISRHESRLAEAGFSLDTVVFVLPALREVTRGSPPRGHDHLAVDGRPDRHHVSAKELCASIGRLACVQAGGEVAATTMLGSLGLRTGEDVGNVVMRLIDIGWIQRLESDTLEDFRGLALIESCPGLPTSATPPL